MSELPFQITDLWNLPASQFIDYSKRLFDWQQKNNKVYAQWVQLMHQQNPSLETLTEIPFLPISFYKTHEVVISETLPSTLFESSGTTEDVVSKHWVKDKTIYEKSFSTCFDLFYGDPADYCVIGLLPSYLERQHSSLVYMVDHLIKGSSHPKSGFYLYDFENVDKVLKELESAQQKTLLIGVSFALMDFCDAYPQQLKHTVVMETGGMKGRKEEMIKSDLHLYLQKGFGVSEIHSEYGMTELLSQAYAKQDGLFKCPPWMKVLVGDEEDPGVLKTSGRGVIHVIDLANVYSCAFIATQDRGELFEDGSFRVLGRMDNSERRGCSLLVV